jgi:hypothetical protein
VPDSSAIEIGCGLHPNPSDYKSPDQVLLLSSIGSVANTCYSTSTTTCTRQSLSNTTSISSCEKNRLHILAVVAASCIDDSYHTLAMESNLSHNSIDTSRCTSSFPAVNCRLSPMINTDTVKQRRDIPLLPKITSPSSTGTCPGYTIHNHD